MKVELKISDKLASIHLYFSPFSLSTAVISKSKVHQEKTGLIEIENKNCSSARLFRQKELAFASPQTE